MDVDSGNSDLLQRPNTLKKFVKLPQVFFRPSFKFHLR